MILAELIAGQRLSHPFAGGVKKPGYTRKHVPLIWECMLGTVFAKDPLAVDSCEEGMYFDYDYAAAHKHAKVAQCTDLRICRLKQTYEGWPREGQLCLMGIPPEKTKIG